jgi:hypothetical protein
MTAYREYTDFSPDSVVDQLQTYRLSACKLRA